MLLCQETFGYELDLTKFTDEEKETVKKQVQSYKELRELIQFGDMYRLLSPFDGNEASWIIVSDDKKEAFVSFFRVLGSPNGPIQRLYLKGLDPNKSYSLNSSTPGVNEVLNGDELMYGGITIPNLEGDYQSVTWTLKAN